MAPVSQRQFSEKGENVSHYQPALIVAARCMHQSSNSRQGTNWVYKIQTEKGKKSKRITLARQIACYVIKLGHNKWLKLFGS